VSSLEVWSAHLAVADGLCIRFDESMVSFSIGRFSGCYTVLGICFECESHDSLTPHTALNRL
jgi:hypothetical protein